MKVRMPDILRSRGSLRRRMVVGLVIVTVLIVAALAFFFWQLSLVQGAVRDLRAENDRLALVLEAGQQAGSAVIVVLDQVADQDAATFVEEVGTSLELLENKRAELNEQLTLLPVGDPVRDRLGVVERLFGELINIVRGTQRHAEDENWPAVEFRGALLLENQAEMEQEVGQLVVLARQRRLEGEEQASGAMQRMATVSVPLVVVSLLIAAVVFFVTIRGVTVGMEQLSGSARRLAEGHFDERVVVRDEQELKQLADSFNMMAEELQMLYTGLEKQVAERTADLENRSGQLAAAAAVARDAAGIRDVEQLLNEVVRLISDRFDFYHAGIFLIDALGEYAVLQAASSEGGQQMLERGHRLRIGEVGIVGYAADSGEPRVALDVGDDAVFFDNPYLPNTRSEMALPLKIRDRVIGVLDVQSVEGAAFSEEDVAVLQTMADQLALAIENARLVAESERTLTELEALYGQGIREAWTERIASQPSAFLYTGVAVEPARFRSQLEMGALTARRQPVLVDEEDGRRLIAPIRLRGQTLGTIVLRQDPERAPWSQEDVSFVEEISTQIGLALENARLLEESQSRAAREELSGEIVTRIRETLDVDTVLQTAVREIGEALDLHDVTIQLSAPTE